MEIRSSLEACVILNANLSATFAVTARVSMRLAYAALKYTYPANILKSLAVRHCVATLLTKVLQ